MVALKAVHKPVPGSVLEDEVMLGSLSDGIPPRATTPAGDHPWQPIAHHKGSFRILLGQLSSFFEEQAAELSLAQAEVSELRSQLREKAAAGPQQTGRLSRAGTIATHSLLKQASKVEVDSPACSQSPMTLYAESTTEHRHNRGLSRATSRATTLGQHPPFLAFMATEEEPSPTGTLREAAIGHTSTDEAESPGLRVIKDDDDFPGEPPAPAAAMEHRRMSRVSNADNASRRKSRRDSRASRCSFSPQGSSGTRNTDMDEEFPLRGEWAQTHHFRRLRRYGKTSLKLVQPEEETILSQRVDEQETGCMRHFISMPHSRFRLAWDLIGAFLILYDLIVIPLRVFEFPENTFTTTMDWVTLIFWTVNMGASCCLGYIQDGHVIMKFRRIVRNYLRSWFIIDVMVVTPDWFFTLLALLSGSKEGNFSSVKLLRMVRLARSVRLLRLLKLRWIMKMFDELLDSEYANIVSNIMKMIFALLAVNHFLACGWFLCAFTQEGETMNWLEFHGHKERHWSYIYLTSLHWSLTQFTPASMDVQPHNPVERTFAISVVVSGLVMFSYLVGSITGSLTQLRSLKEEASKQFFQLRHFLRQKKVNATLKLKIEKYLEHAWQRQQDDMSVNHVKLLLLLSDQLYRELQSALYVPPLLIHPLFDVLNKENHVTMHRLANSAVSQKHFASQDRVFFPSEVARHTYFVRTGRLIYHRMDALGEESGRELVDAEEDWIAEPILWTQEWRHLGTLVSESHSSLVLVEATCFCDVMQMNPNALSIVVLYAGNFMKWMNAKKKEALSDITQGEDVTETLRTFLYPKEELQQKIGQTSPPNRSVTLQTLAPNLGLQVSSSRLFGGAGKLGSGKIAST
mmetsp:Transcript_64518/g.154083  ORF Transcript_64518/g.154083 Transcript_64518/m.154083 type:complete len:856 (-) Transcript_64518:44-2611(-)